MKPQTLLSVGYALLGVLAIAGFSVAIGQQDSTTRPVISSYGPSGASAFATLLRRSGIDVVADGEIRPRLSTSDLAIAFMPRIEEESLDLNGSASMEERFEQSLLAFARSGGNVVVLPFASTFVDASKELETQPVLTVERGVRDAKLATTMQLDAPSISATLVPNDAPETAIWSAGRKAVVRYLKIDKGGIVLFGDGLAATNRFIDRADNAALLLSVIKPLARGGRAVFVEAGAGNIHERGLFERIGNWATVAWYQFLLLALTAATTLGIRFGYPETSRVRQRGSRELLDAYAEILRRGRKHRQALRVVVTAIEARRSELSEEARSALDEAHAALRDPTMRTDQAVSLARRLESLTASDRKAV